MLKLMLWLKSKSESNECNRVQKEEQQNPMEHTIETARAASRAEAGQIETLLTGLAWLDRALAGKEQSQNSQRVLGSAGWYELSTEPPAARLGASSRGPGGLAPQCWTSAVRRAA